MKNKYKRNLIICEVLSWMLRCVPALVFIIIGFVNGTKNEKIVISLVTVVAIFIIAITLIGKLKLWRLIFVIVLILLCWVGSELALMITIVGGANVLDEVVMMPLIKYYHKKAEQRSQAIEIAMANKEVSE